MDKSMICSACSSHIKREKHVYGEKNGKCHNEVKRNESDTHYAKQSKTLCGMILDG